MRIYALSDLHVDFSGNRTWVESLSRVDYRQDVLIVAGDISHQHHHLVWTLEALRERFARVFFVPGNHDLWLSREDYPDSLAKWWALRRLCETLEVEVEPARIAHGPWIVPLLSWYTLPGGGEDTLARGRPPEGTELSVWTDTHLIRWPHGVADHPAARLVALNGLPTALDGPVISFSHFLPRGELLSAVWPPGRTPSPRRRIPFNFSWVAGSQVIETQIRRLGASIHVYGHQHRNRRRRLDGVVYLSHCLGYPRERQRGDIAGLEAGPLLVWDTDLGASPVIPWDGEPLPL